MEMKKYWFVSIDSDSIPEGLKDSLKNAEVEFTFFILNSNLASPSEYSVNGNVREIRVNPDFFVNQNIPMGDFAKSSAAAANILEKYIIDEGAPDAVEIMDHKGLAYFTLQRKKCLESVFQDSEIIVYAKEPLFVLLKEDKQPSFKLPDYWVCEMERFSYLAADRLILSSPVLLEKLKEENLTKDAYVLAGETYAERVKILCGKRLADERCFPVVRERAKQYVDLMKNSTPDLLSIVIPYYNMGEYVEDTLKSVFDTTYASYEVIVVDDGSTDLNSVRIIEELKEKYNFKLIKQQNQGLPSTRNNGAAQASGEFLAFLDSDDMVEPDYYGKAVRILKQYDNIGFVGCNAQYFGERSDIWQTWNPEMPYFLCKNTMATSSLVMKKNVFMEFGLNDKNMIYGMEDYEAVIRIIGSGYHGVSMPYALFLYRVRTGSMSNRFSEGKITYLYEKIADNNCELFKDYVSGIANILNNNGKGWDYDNPTMVNSSIHEMYQTQLDNVIRLEKQVREYMQLSEDLEKQAAGFYKDYLTVHKLYEELKARYEREKI